MDSLFFINPFTVLEAKNKIIFLVFDSDCNCIYCEHVRDTNTLQSKIKNRASCREWRTGMEHPEEHAWQYLSRAGHSYQIIATEHGTEPDKMGYHGKIAFHFPLSRKPSTEKKPTRCDGIIHQTT